MRSLALAATGAIALFGSIALGGSRDDLLRGITDYTSHYVAAADIWLVNPGDNQAINDFTADHHTASIARLPGVASVTCLPGKLFEHRRPADLADRMAIKHAVGTTGRAVRDRRPTQRL